MFQGFSKGVSRKIEGHFKAVFKWASRVFERYPKSVSEKLTWCFKEFSKKFQGCLKSVSRVFHEMFKGVSRKI